MLSEFSHVHCVSEFHEMRTGCAQMSVGRGLPSLQVREAGKPPGELKNAQSVFSRFRT